MVRPIDAEDTIGSIIVPLTVQERMTAHQCEVVAVGAPEICEDEDCERSHMSTSFDPREPRLHLCPFNLVGGDWLLVRPRSFIDTDTPERKLWLVRQSDVLAIIDDS